MLPNISRTSYLIKTNHKDTSDAPQVNMGILWLLIRHCVQNWAPETSATLLLHFIPQGKSKPV